MSRTDDIHLKQIQARYRQASKKEKAVIRRAREAELPIGSYHYLYPQPAPEEQALACYEALEAGQGFGDELPPVVDVEQDGLWEARARGSWRRSRS